MLHARIAARAFNTPLLVEPSKAMAFLSGLGPRVLGRQVDVANADGLSEHAAPPPASSLETSPKPSASTAMLPIRSLTALP